MRKDVLSYAALTKQYPHISLEKAQKVTVAQRTDFIHHTLIPEAARLNIDFLTQLVWIHKVHMENMDEFTTNEGNNNEYAGVMRSDTGMLRAEMGIYSSFTNETTYIAPRAEHVLPLLTQLVERVEAGTDAIRGDTIYEYFSAIQLAFLLIHPFSQGNGRVSEDMLYALWEKLPEDIRQKTVRYPSNHGGRDELLNKVQLRNWLMSDSIEKIVAKIATKMFPQCEEEVSIGILRKLWSSTTGDENNWLMERYDALLLEEITQLIENIHPQHVDTLKHVPYMKQLARNLRTSAHKYRYGYEEKLLKNEKNRFRRRRDKQAMVETVLYEPPTTGEEHQVS